MQINNLIVTNTLSRHRLSSCYMECTFSTILNTRRNKTKESSKKSNRLYHYCVCVKRITLCNCLCSSSPSSPSRSSALSGISGNSEQKTILQTTEQLMQFMVLEIQFRSLKYMTVIRIRKNLSNIPFLSKR